MRLLIRIGCAERTMVESSATPPVILRATAALWPEPLRLLVVEDDAEAAELVKGYLATCPEEPFDLEFTPNLMDAMLRLQHPGVGAVLLDLGLPELKGYKTFRTIDWMTDRRIPIVIFTADALRHAIHEAVVRYRRDALSGQTGGRQ
jgi:CheY-like chemotaxis protein